MFGSQGVGKSSVLNLLANRLGNQKEPFTGPFTVESADSLMNNHPQTLGVDMYITQDRVILLDTQVFHFCYYRTAFFRAFTP